MPQSVFLWNFRVLKLLLIKRKCGPENLPFGDIFICLLFETRFHYVAQAGPYLECWDDRHVAPCPACNCFVLFFELVKSQMPVVRTGHRVLIPPMLKVMSTQG